MICIEWNGENSMTKNYDAYRGNETILIADDERELLDLMGYIISQCGYNVITANDGQSAVELYRKNISDITLIILDVNMPNKDGIAAYSEIKLINPDANIIFTSGAVKQLATIGNPTIILKPFTPIEILKLIRKSIDS